MDLIPARNGLCQLQKDLARNSVDFDAAYQSIQGWAAGIRQETAFEPLTEGIAMRPKPMALLTLENEIDDLLEALQTHDLGRTRHACEAAITAISRLP
jgi:hypothetical protein